MSGTEEAITIRRVPLTFPAGIDPVLVEGQPEESYVQVGLSLLLPYLEPYLIRTMQEAKPRVTDAKLARELALFNGQEGQHYRQHIRFNEAVRLNGFSGLKELEAEVDADYKRFSDEKSLRWNLAYAEGFEAFTMAMARFSFEQKAFDRMHPAAGELYRWHLIEELEHRTVAFDVYAHVSGGYFYRLIIGLYAQWHLNRFVIRAAIRMLRSDPKGFRAKYGGLARGLLRLAPQLWRATWGLTPKILWTYFPWYSPHRIEMPAEAKELAAHYTKMSEEAKR